MKSFRIITFGCQMNEHDSERIAGILEQSNYTAARVVEDADIVIVNTCSIRQKAEQKFYSELGRLSRLKAERPGMTIAVAGCIAQQEGPNIVSRAPSVDIVFGPNDIARLPEIVKERERRRSPIIDIAGDAEYHRRTIPALRSHRLKAWVSIMYGCDNFCTYCVVPRLRGRERSRTPEDITAEVRNLAQDGYREVTLLGQNVNSYGRESGRDVDFPALLGMVHDVPGIERIRFVTSHPKDLSERLISAIRDLPKVCESIHLPVQSGSDRILSLMNRRYTRSEYLEKGERLRGAVPEIALTTDIIVGFPGETEQDFEMTMRLLEEVQFDGIFAFKYSRRPGTAALELTGHVDEPVKEARLASALSLQKGISIKKNRQLAGSVAEVLIDGRSKRGGMLSGRTRGNKVVNLAGPDSLIGSVVDVRITSAGANSLTGEMEQSDQCASHSAPSGAR